MTNYTFVVDKDRMDEHVFDYQCYVRKLNPRGVFKRTIEKVPEFEMYRVVWALIAIDKSSPVR